MLASRQLVRLAAPSIRAYATVKRSTNLAPPADESIETAPPPIPMSSAPLYNPDAEPALHASQSRVLLLDRVTPRPPARALTPSPRNAVGYPALSSASRQLRNPKGWWDNQERVNFGEPVRTNRALDTKSTRSLTRSRSRSRSPRTTTSRACGHQTSTRSSPRPPCPSSSSCLAQSASLPLPSTRCAPSPTLSVALPLSFGNGRSN